MSKHGVKRIVVDVSPTFHKSVKRKALDEEVSVSEVVRDFLEAWERVPPGAEFIYQVWRRKPEP